MRCMEGAQYMYGYPTTLGTIYSLVRCPAGTVRKLAQLEAQGHGCADCPPPSRRR